MAENSFFNFNSPVVRIDEKSYNKAIDEFAERLLENAPRNFTGELELGGHTCYLSANKVMEIAEELKGVQEC